MFCQKWLLRTVMMGWVASFAGAAAAADTVVRQFSIGTTSTTVGIAAAGEDVELTGPQALTSDVQGNLFVLDQINGRILKFNPKQPLLTKHVRLNIQQSAELLPGILRPTCVARSIGVAAGLFRSITYARASIRPHQPIGGWGFNIR